MITFLKLGGSLITDKARQHTARFEIIQRLAAEIYSAQQSQPDLRLVVGHGSGSFGHIPAKKYHTHEGVRTPAEWSGFLEVWRHARDLNQIVLDALTQAGIRVMSFPPSSFIHSADRKPTSVQAEPILSALTAGLVPLVAGDVIFDSKLGGTIFSTEDVFLTLAPIITPDRVFLCGLEPGVYEDYPHNTRLLSKITPEMVIHYRQNLGGSANIDVTGGMRTKVEQMVELVSGFPTTQAVIFSGTQPGVLSDVLTGHAHGTKISQ